METLHLTADTFNDAIKEGVFVVDFWADWCGPCKMVAPVLDELAAAHKGEFTLAKVNIDDQPALAEQFGIQSIPTVVLFRDGTPEIAAIGARPIEDYEEMLKPIES